MTKMATDEWRSEMVDAWDQTLSEIDGIRQTAVQNEIPLLLVIAPYRFQLSEPEKTNQPQIRLLRYAKTHDVPVVDLLPLFASIHKKPGSPPFFRDANHFSVAGDAHTAEFLVEPILALLDGKGNFP